MALAWKVSIRQKRIQGSNPCRSANRLFHGISFRLKNGRIRKDCACFLLHPVCSCSRVTRIECGSRCGNISMGRLSATAVKAAKLPGRYGDGDGLYLLVSPTGGCSWVCRVQKYGKRRDFGLGSAKKVTLAQARDKSSKIRSQVEAGIDPIAERRKEEGIPTFREAAVLVFAENKKN